MTLLDCCDFIVDCEHKTAPIQEEGYPSIRTPNIGRGTLLLDGVNRVSEATYQGWTRRAAPKTGDLILAREAPVGNIAVIPENLRCCLGQRTVLIRPNPQIVDSYYLCFLLLTSSMQGQLLGKSGGATVHHLNMKDIRALPMPSFPTIEEQKKIAGVIRAYDDLIETNRRRIALLEESAWLLYREWFVKLRFPGHELVEKVDGVPAGWKWQTLKQIAFLNYGKALKESERKEGEVPVYGSSGVVGRHNKALVPGPSIIVGRKGNVGSVYFSRNASHPIDTVYFISSQQTTYYLYLLLQTMNFISSDAAVPGLNREYAHGLPVLCPSPSILSRFEAEVDSLFQQAETLQRMNNSAVEARDALLPKLMSGQLTV